MKRIKTAAIHLFYLAVIALAAWWIIDLRRELREERETGGKRQSELMRDADAYRRQRDSLDKANSVMYGNISALAVRYDRLEKVKQKTVIRYERNEKNLLNPALVGNDSISRYIRSKITDRP
jgi:hypothetical protein